MFYIQIAFFVLGLLVAYVFNFTWPIVLFILLISFSCFVFIRDKFSFSVLAVVSFFTFGILRILFLDNNVDPNLFSKVGKELSMTVLVTEERDVRDTSIKYIARPLESKSKILVTSNSKTLYDYGDRLELVGKLENPKNFLGNSGIEFDYINYLAKDRVHFVMYNPYIKKVGESEGNKIVSTLYKIKNKFINRIEQVVPEPYSSLLGGLLFGTKQSLGNDLLEVFRKSGLVHIIVLSGFNLTIVAVAISYVAGFFGSRKFGFVFGTIGILIFALMVGLGATVVRASVMAVIAIIAKYLGRPSDALRALFVAGFLMLLYNPLSLFHDLSFRLSFMATLGLILFSPFLEKFIATKIPFIPKTLGLREILGATFSVQLFLLPMLINISGDFSVVSFLANLVVLPFVSSAMLFGFLTGLFGLVPIVGYFLSWPFGAVAYSISFIMISIAEFLSSLPFATISVGALPTYCLIFWYAFCAFIYHKFYRYSL